MGKRNLFAMVALAAGSLGAVGSALASSEIYAPPSSQGHADWSDLWGDAPGRAIPPRAALGELFHLGNDTELQTFSFWVQSDIGFGHLGTPNVQAFVYEWSNVAEANKSPYGKVIGSALYSSPVKALGNDWTRTMRELSFNTGGIQLAKDKTYVAFLTTLGAQDGSPDRLVLASNHDDAPNSLANTAVGLSWTSSKNGSNSLADIATEHWGYLTSPASHDALAFRATFTAPVPEPETYAMLLAGLGVLAVGVKRRRG